MLVVVCNTSSPAVPLSSHGLQGDVLPFSMPGCVTAQNPWPWGPVCSCMAALLETWAWWQLLGHLCVGFFSPSHERGWVAGPGSSVVPVYHVSVTTSGNAAALASRKGSQLDQLPRCISPRWGAQGRWTCESTSPWPPSTGCSATAGSTPCLPPPPGPCLGL